MRRLSVLVALVAMIALAGSATASPATLKTFGTGVVTITGADSATIVNDFGEYGGVYIQSKSQSSKPLNKVVFQFTSRGDVAGGAPRFSLPIDTDGNPNTIDYAFLDAAGCGAPVGPNTTVATLVSTQNPVCKVNFNSVDYANWAAFAADNPTYRIGQGWTPFIIADVVGSYNVTDIVLR